MKLIRRPLFCLSLLLALPVFADEQAPAPSVAPAPAAPSHQLYFSPQDKVDARLIALIESEKTEIRAAVYCLTHRGIIKSLIDARKRGVNVELIVDPFTIKAKAPLRRMAQAGIAIYVWDPKPIVQVDIKEKSKKKERRPLMHNKFCVFGQNTVWTGSFNFTSEASHANQENVVVLKDADAAKRYVDEFERVKDEGCSPFTTYLADRPKKNKGKII